MDNNNMNNNNMDNNNTLLSKALLNRSLDDLCKFLIEKQKSLDKISNQSLGSFKRYNGDSYEIIREYFKNDLNNDTLVAGLSSLFQVYDTDSYNEYSISILKSIIDNKFSKYITDSQERGNLQDIYERALVTRNDINFSQPDLDSIINRTRENNNIAPSHISDSTMLNYLVDLNNSTDESHSNNENLDGISTNQFEEGHHGDYQTTSNNANSTRQLQENRNENASNQINIINAATNVNSVPVIRQNENLTSSQQPQPLINVLAISTTVQEQQSNLLGNQSTVTNVQANIVDPPLAQRQQNIRPSTSFQPQQNNNTLINSVNNSSTRFSSSVPDLQLTLEKLIKTVNNIPELVDKKINARLNLKLNNEQNSINFNNAPNHGSSLLNNNISEVLTSSKTDKDHIIRDLSNNIRKIIRTENNINLMHTHLTNNTTPTSLTHFRFPTPFLCHNEDYVTGYNLLIEDFQKKIIDYNILESEKIIKKTIEKIRNNKINLKSRVEDIDKLVKNLYSQCEAELLPSFKKSDYKVKNVKIKKFSVKKVNFNDSYYTLNNSNDLNNSETGTRNDPIIISENIDNLENSFSHSATHDLNVTDNSYVKNHQTNLSSLNHHRPTPLQYNSDNDLYQQGNNLRSRRGNAYNRQNDHSNYFENNLANAPFNYQHNDDRLYDDHISKNNHIYRQNHHFNKRTNDSFQKTTNNFNSLTDSSYGNQFNKRNNYSNESTSRHRSRDFSNQRNKFNLNKSDVNNRNNNYNKNNDRGNNNNINNNNNSHNNRNQNPETNYHTTTTNGNSNNSKNFQYRPRQPYKR